MPDAKSRLSRAFTLTFLYTLGHAHSETCVDLTLVDKSLPDLNYVHARWPELTVKKPVGNPYLGRQNLTYCCIQAVNEYLENGCVNTSLVQVDETILRPDVQFPCGAVWTSNSASVPDVRVTNSWARQHCPGWQISEAGNRNKWAELLVAFALPAIVPSFSIHRSRKLRMRDLPSPAHKSYYKVFVNVKGTFTSFIRVTTDTVIWLMVTFAFAGPLFLSGIYETSLDKRVVDYLSEYISDDELPLGLKARMLLTILYGNRDIHPIWNNTMDLARCLDDLDRVSPSFSNIHNSTTSHKAAIAQARTQLPQDLNFVNSGPDVQSRVDFEIPTPDIQGVASPQYTSDIKPPAVEKMDQSLEDEHCSRSQTVKMVKLMLKALLASRQSSAATVVPVVFFLVSLVYLALSLKQPFGGRPMVEFLVFGCWWMILPIFTVVSDLSLVGNGLKGSNDFVNTGRDRYVVGDSLIKPVSETSRPIASLAESNHEIKSRVNVSYSYLTEMVDETDPKPVWMWDRGRCKQDWLLLLFTDAWTKYETDGRSSKIHIHLANFLNRIMIPGATDWIVIRSSALLLVLAPCILGALITHYTPGTGNHHRSLTFLAYYMWSQTLLLLFWAHRLTWGDRYWVLGNRVNRILRNKSTVPELDSWLVTKTIKKMRVQAFKDISEPDFTKSGLYGILVFPFTYNKGQWRETKAHIATQKLFCSLCIIYFGVSLFSFITGSLMEMTGMYRNTLHQPKVVNTLLKLSTNSSVQFHEAERYWTILGACSALLLGLICYMGWQYQRRLRAKFYAITNRLDGNSTARKSKAAGLKIAERTLPQSDADMSQHTKRD